MEKSRREGKEEEIVVEYYMRSFSLNSREVNSKPFDNREYHSSYTINDDLTKIWTWEK